jgi:hypothetical protein
VRGRCTVAKRVRPPNGSRAFIPGRELKPREVRWPSRLISKP